MSMMTDDSQDKADRWPAASEVEVGPEEISSPPVRAVAAPSAVTVSGTYPPVALAPSGVVRPGKAEIAAAASKLDAGEVVVFPTETVYGMGVKVAAGITPAPLYRIKRRSPDKPTAWLIADASLLNSYGVHVPLWARELSKRFWPGPLTLIVTASAAVPSGWVGPSGSVALRVPADETALALLDAVNAPIATSSANIQGRIPPRAPWHIAHSVRAQVSAVLEAGLSQEAVSSTIVDATGSEPVVIRVGPLSSAQISEATGLPVRIRTQMSRRRSPSTSSSDADDGAAIVVKDIFTVLSSDGIQMQRGFVWMPSEVASGARKPRGTLQLVHGMIEFVERYESFARYLVSRGWVVYGCDLRGHGDSVDSPDQWGSLPLRGGDDLLIADTLAVYRAGCVRFPDVPHLIFAHSMGTFIVRSLIGRTDSEGLAPDGKPWDLQAVVISGTGDSASGLSRFGNLLARSLAIFKGADATSDLLDNLSLAPYNKFFEPASTPVDWLSRAEENRSAYLDEPRDTFRFKLSGYAALTALLLETVDGGHVACIPKELPWLFVSGSKDPVGEMGAGVERSVLRMREAGVHRVDEHLFADDRHEILNEVDRDEVFSYIAAWMEER
jgi:tRNA threonylcarbamoyl adenosine modification protein (Sua5/YciO/YrdC/YwlC family)